MNDTWSLPGAQDFLDDLKKSRRQGQDIIVHSPYPLPAGLVEAIKRTFSDSYVRAHSVIPACDPLEQLAEGLGASLQGSEVEALERLLKRLEDCILLVDSIQPSDWPAWESYLSRHAQLAQSMARDARPGLILLAQIPTLQGTGKLNNVSMLDASCIFTELDMLVHVRRNMETLPKSFFLNKVRVQMIANIALWDFALAEMLLELDPRELSSPLETLQRLATLPETRHVYAKPVIRSHEGAPTEHSLSLAVRNMQEAIDMRIAMAQIQFVFPMVEELRIILARRVKGKIHVPAKLEGNDIRSVEDLEIGPLAFFCSESCKVDLTTLDFCHRLRIFRNSLAHLMPLTWPELLELETLAKKLKASS